MINNMEELFELVDTYHTWIKRLLVTIGLLGVAFGGYHYGYSAGRDRAFEYDSAHIQDLCTPDEKQKSSLHTDEPGKMWEPEA